MNDASPDSTPVPPARRLGRLVWLVPLGFVCAALVWGVVAWVGGRGAGDDGGGAVRPVSDRGTVVLVPSADSPVPYRWALYRDRRAVEAACEAAKTWGPVRVAPGRYYLGLRPYNIRCREVVFDAPVEAVAGQVTRVDVSARVGVRAPERLAPVYRWAILPTAGDRPVQYAERNWQAQIVPPGRYRIRVTQRSHHSRPVIWPGTVEARSGTCAWVSLNSSVRVMPTRDGQRLDWWKVVRARDGSVVQTAYRTWSAQVVPPGQYRVAVREARHCRLDVVLPGVIELKPGTHATVAVDSRLALSGPDDAPPPDRWLIYPEGGSKPVQIVARAWTAAIVPPGTYDVRVVQQAEAREVTVATDVRVLKDRTAEVRVAPRVGIAQSPGLRLPYEWVVYRVGSWEAVQVARRTWEPQYVAPGTYRVAVRQSADETPVLFPDRVTVSAGGTATVDVGSRLRPDVAPWVSRVPDEWRIVHADSRKLVKVVRARWGAQIVPPGRYRVEILASRDTGLWVVWPEAVAVRRGQESVLPLRSGLRAEADPDWPVPKRWEVLDPSARRVQKGIASWPTVLLPPGTYRVRVRWALDGNYRVLADGVVVRAGQVTRIEVRKAQIPGELFGR